MSLPSEPLPERPPPPRPPCQPMTQAPALPPLAPPPPPPWPLPPASAPPQHRPARSRPPPWLPPLRCLSDASLPSIPPRCRPAAPAARLPLRLQRRSLLLLLLPPPAPRGAPPPTGCCCGGAAAWHGQSWTPAQTSQPPVRRVRCSAPFWLHRAPLPCLSARPVWRSGARSCCPAAQAGRWST